MDEYISQTIKLQTCPWGGKKKNIFICFLNQKYNKITIKVEKNNSALE